MNSNNDGNNNKSLLVGALVCVGLAIVTYLLKWVSLYFMKASIWQTADTIEEVGRYMDEGGYTVIAGLLRIGAIVAIALLAWDGYRIAKPLLNGPGTSDNACKAGIGGIIAIIYAIMFFILVMASNSGDMSGASMTIWPFVNVVLCITYKVMLGKVDTSTGTSNWRSNYTSTVPVSTSESEDRPTVASSEKSIEKDDDAIEIPITNYDPDGPIQLCALRCLKNTGKASLILAVYDSSKSIQALRVRFDFRSVFGDSLTTEAIPFLSLKPFTGALLMTEPAEIDVLKAHRKEIESARAVIDAVRAREGSMPVPSNYQEVEMSTKELKRMKKGRNRDAVCKKRVFDNQWCCACGKINSIAAEKCARCGRSSSVTDYSVIIEQLDEASTTVELFKVLDDAVEEGMESLRPVREKINHYRFLDVRGIRNQIKKDIGELQK